MPACHSENNYLLAIECDRITLEAILLPTGSDEKYSKIQGYMVAFLRRDGIYFLLNFI